MEPNTDTRSTLPTDRPIHLAIVDDHAIVVDSMICLFDTMPGHRVTHTATNAEDFLAGLTAEVHVDIALIDLQMAGTDGLAVLERMRQAHPAIKCIAFSFNDEHSWVRKAIDAGARGYMLKNSGRDVLRETIRNVLTSGFHYTDLVRESLASHATTGHAAETVVPRWIDRSTLPPREREFLEHLLRPGTATYQEFAILMGVSLSTVYGYCRYFTKHFQTHSRADLVKLGVSPPPPPQSA